MSDSATPPTAAASAPTRPAPLSPARRGALVAFRILGIVTLLAGVVQFVFAGLGAFGASFDPHRMLGNAFGAATVVLLVLMLIARPGTRAVLLTVLLVVLAFAVQPLLANLGDDTDAWFGGLHALNALAMMGLLGNLTAIAARATRRSSDAAPTA